MDARRTRLLLVRPRAGRHHHLVGAVAVALAVLLLTSCGADDAGSAGTAAPGSTPVATPAASSLLVRAQDLPSGFRDSGGQDGGYRQTVCGVDIEPVPPVDSASARFSEGPLGPFVEQRVRVYAGDTDVVSRVRAALEGCTKYSLPATASGPAAVLDVQRLDVPPLGDESVAWSQTARTDVPITTDVVMIRSGNTVALVTSYALKTPPDPDVVMRAAQAVAARLAR